MARTVLLSVCGIALFCAGAAWVAVRLIGLPATAPADRPAPVAAPDPVKASEVKARPSVEIKRGISRRWFDAIHIDYKGGYLDAWVDMEIYGVRDELALTLPHLVNLVKPPRALPKTTSSSPEGCVNVVIFLQRGSSPQGLVVRECYLDAYSSEPRPEGQTEQTSFGFSLQHPLPFSCWESVSWGSGRSFDPGDGVGNHSGSPTHVPLYLMTHRKTVGTGKPNYPDLWREDTSSADPDLWDDHERRLGTPVARAAVATLGFTGPFTPALAAVPVPMTYQDLHLCGCVVQVKYRFLTEREVDLLRARGERGSEREIEQMIRGFRRTPNRIDVPEK